MGSSQKCLKYLKRCWPLYVMLIPGIVYLILFKYWPMFGVTLAFKNYKGLGPISSASWIGMQNFTRIFSTPAFTRALKNNIEISLLKLIFGFPSPIILALFINSLRVKPVKQLVQTVSIIPSFVSWIIVYGLLYAVFSPNIGALQALLETFGYTGKIPDLLVQKSTFRYMIVGSYIWKEAGSGAVMYLAAITNIDPNLYEAAALDGAGKFRQMWHITLSGIRTTIATLFLMRVGGLMYAGFDQIFVMSNDAVIAVTDIIDTYVYRLGLTQNNISRSTAAGLFQSAIGLVLVVGSNYLVKKIEPDSGLF